MNSTIQKNLELMTSSMHRLLMRESFGGNAGSWRGKSCAAANFYYNPETGEINVFGNYQDLPENITRASEGGTFRVALDITSCKYRIIQTFLEEYTEEAKKIIEESANQYNEIYSFKESILWNF